MPYPFKTSLCAVLAVAGFALAAPASSQTTSELTVTGSIRDLPRVSRTVSYADLDLTTATGQDVLKTRVRDTARDLCEKLGEPNVSYHPLIPTCESDAVASASNQVKLAIASAQPRAPQSGLAVNEPAPAPAPAAAAAPSYAAPASSTSSPAPRAARN